MNSFVCRLKIHFICSFCITSAYVNLFFVTVIPLCWSSAFFLYLALPLAQCVPLPPPSIVILQITSQTDQRYLHIIYCITCTSCDQRYLHIKYCITSISCEQRYLHIIQYIALLAYPVIRDICISYTSHYKHIVHVQCTSCDLRYLHIKYCITCLSCSQRFFAYHILHYIHIL